MFLNRLLPHYTATFPMQIHLHICDQLSAASRGAVMHPLTRWQDKIKSALVRSPRKLLCTLSFLMVMATTGCGLVKLRDSERAFAGQFPYEDVNDSLVLCTIEGITETRIDHIVILQLENHSSQMIAYSTKEGIIGIAYDPGSKSWVEVENRVQYPDIQWLLGPPGSDIPSISAVDYEPALEDPPGLLEIRIVVIGHVYDEAHGFGEAVVAYFDLTLEK